MNSESSDQSVLDTCSIMRYKSERNTSVEQSKVHQQLVLDNCGPFLTSYKKQQPENSHDIGISLLLTPVFLFADRKSPWN